MRVAIFFGDLNDCVIVDKFLFDKLRRSLQYRVRNIGAPVYLASRHRHVDLGAGITGDELWISQAEQPGKEPAVDINIMSDGLSADAQARARAQLFQAIQPQLRPCAKNILRCAVGRAKVNQLVDIILDARRAEHRVGDQTGADIGEDQAIGFGVIDIVCRLSTAAARHELRDDDRLARKIFPQKWNGRLRAQRAGAARLAPLDQYNRLALKVGRGLAKERCAANEKSEKYQGRYRQSLHHSSPQKRVC